MAIHIPIISSFDGKGVSKAVRDFKKLEKGSDKAAFSLLNANAAVTRGVASFAKFSAIGAGVVGVVGGKFVAAAYESQKVMRQTEAIVKATGGAANMTAKQIANLAQEMSNKTGIDDEAIQTSMNLLLTFKQVRNEIGKGNDIFNRASMAALDLGNVFGSTDAAAKMLGKALSDPIKGVTALQRAGVNFSTQQRAQIKTLVQSGKTLEAQKMILKEVESQVGGTAVASATGFDRMRVAVENVAEDIGTVLIPYVEKFAAFVIDKVVPVLQQFSKVLGEQGVGAAFNFLAGSIIKGVWNMGALGKAITVLVGLFGALKVATLAFVATQTVLKIAAQATTGALNAQIVALNATKVALLAAGGVTALLTIAASLYSIYAATKGTAIKKTREFSDALFEENDAQKQAIAQLITSQKAFRYLAQMLDMSGQGVGAFEQFINNGSGALANFKERLDAAIASNRDMIYWNTKGQAFSIPIDQAKIYQKALNDLIGKQKEYTETQKLLKAIGIDTANSTNQTSTTVKTAAERFKDYVSALRGAKSEQKSYASAVKSTKDATTALSEATANVAKAQEYYDKVVRGFGAGSDEAIDAQNELTQAQRDAKRAGIDVTRANKAVSDAEKALARARMRRNPEDIAEAELALTEAQLDAEDASNALKEANDAVIEAQTKLNEVLNGASTASDTYKTALDALNEAKQKEVEAADNVADAIDREADAKFRLAEAEKELRTARTGVSKEQAQQAQKQTGIDGKTVTDKRKEFLAKINKQLGTKFKTINDYINSTSDATGKENRKEAFNRFARQNNIPQLAKGGIVMEPTLALIGEKAPEAVIPLSQLNTQSTKGDTYITVTVTSADPNAVVDALRRYQRQNGALPLRVAG